MILFHGPHCNCYSDLSIVQYRFSVVRCHSHLLLTIFFFSVFFFSLLPFFLGSFLFFFPVGFFFFHS